MAYSLTLATISFLLAVIWGPPLIALLKRNRIGQIIRLDGPQEHQGKMGTPTMGGFMILVPVFVLTVAANRVQIISSTPAGELRLTPLGVSREFLVGRSVSLPRFA